MALASSRNILLRRLLSVDLLTRSRIKSCWHDAILARHFESNGGLSNTSLIMQNGMDIQELPLVVKKVSGVQASVLLFKNNNDNSENEINASSNNINDISEEEQQAISNGFRNCSSINEILKLLEVVPSAYVNSSVAVHILRKMIELDDASKFFENSSLNDELSSNFTKTAVFNQLMNIILSGNEPNPLLDCLILMNVNPSFKKTLAPYFEKLRDQILLLTTENKYEVKDLCCVVHGFHIAGCTAEIDKLWVSFTEQFGNIDETNVLNVFQTLAYFDKSRAVIANMLHRKMISLWWNLSGNHIAEILSISKETRTNSYKLMQIFARWLNTKIHSLSEDELLSIVNGFLALDFVNSQIITALERYIRIKGMNIKKEELFSGIMNYCLHFRIRSIPILNKCCDYFIQNGRTISPSNLHSIIVPFGYLDYYPDRSYEYWKLLEEILKDKFSQFHPERLLDILLSCVYIEKFPINFINDIFNPFFLTNLQDKCVSWNTAKMKLKLVDQAMTLECSSYPGPLLFKDFQASSYKVDDRLKVFVNSIKDLLISIAGSEDKLYFFKLARSKFSSNNAHIIDVLITSPRNSSQNNSQTPSIALLFHLPEHYSLTDGSLIGPQVMRQRHLKKLGYKVVDLNYVELVKLCSYRKVLVRHLKKSVENN